LLIEAQARDMRRVAADARADGHYLLTRRVLTAPSFSCSLTPALGGERLWDFAQIASI